MHPGHRSRPISVEDQPSHSPLTHYNSSYLGQSKSRYCKHSISGETFLCIFELSSYKIIRLGFVVQKRHADGIHGPCNPGPLAGGEHQTNMHKPRICKGSQDPRILDQRQFFFFFLSFCFCFFEQQGLLHRNRRNVRA